jgi:hypothetical protein
MAVASLAKSESAASYKFYIWDGQYRPLTALNALAG